MCPTKGDIIKHITARLGQEETPATMNASPEGEIRGKISQIILENARKQSPWEPPHILS